MATAEVAEGAEVVNRYSGRCVECKRFVGRSEGIVRREGGKWRLYCFGCSVEGAEAPGLAAYEEAQQDVAYTEAMAGNWAGGGLR